MVVSSFYVHESYLLKNPWRAHEQPTPLKTFNHHSRWWPTAPLKNPWRTRAADTSKLLIPSLAEQHLSKLLISTRWWPTAPLKKKTLARSRQLRHLSKLIITTLAEWHLSKHQRLGAQPFFSTHFHLTMPTPFDTVTWHNAATWLVRPHMSRT